MPTRRERVQFPNARGQMLAGALELPKGAPRGTALFAHCFSCGKEVLAAGRIARGLAGQGFAVLRFDFTGLGGSEGDFANTDFSSNLADLLAAADYLRAHFQAPGLLVGHSLGGAAVLAVARQIPESRAVVTIGAPAGPAHLLKHLVRPLAELEPGEAPALDIGGHPFQVTPAFLDDIAERELAGEIAGLGRALLVFHAPGDTVVSIDEAAKIYRSARHPKSFISLAGADHMLSGKADSDYVARVIAAWAARYLEGEGQAASEAAAAPEVGSGRLWVGEANKRFLRRIASDDHAWLADEPKRAGGDNLGPDPYELLLAALGACTSMTLRMYANRESWPLEDVEVELSHSREHCRDSGECEEGKTMLDVMERQLKLHGPLDAEQRARLVEIADRCPVHRTLDGHVSVRTTLAEAGHPVKV